MIIFHQKINLIFNKKPLELIIVYRDWEMELTRFLMKSQMKGNRSSKETISRLKLIGCPAFNLSMQFPYFSVYVECVGFEYYVFYLIFNQFSCGINYYLID